MTFDATPPAVSTMRRDLLSAYLASGAKVASWALATMLLFQFGGPGEFALFALIRGTLSFLNYTTLGLAPAIIHALTKAAAMAEPAVVNVQSAAVTTAVQFADDRVLSYQTREHYAAERDPEFHAKQIGFSSLLLAGMLGVIGCLAAICYAVNAPWIHGIRGYRWTTMNIAIFLGVGISLRLASDACGALLQAFGKIAADNAGMVIAESVWILTLLAQVWGGGRVDAESVAGAFLFSSIILLLYRIVAVPVLLGPSRPRLAFFSASIAGNLLWFGVMVSVAQLADYLYAPTDFLLINHLLGLPWVGFYAPAVQIDAGLLLVVGGLASVMLPKAAIAHARGNTALIRQYFIRGTLASTAMLLLSAGAVWALAPRIFQLWLHNDMPATQAILPLILIHTVVGGSSAVGRSILLGMGKVKPFTVAVLVAGVSNVVLSYSFVRFGHMGLNGIVLGTICAVVGRCAVWQPWYVWRLLKGT